MMKTSNELMIEIATKSFANLLEEDNDFSDIRFLCEEENVFMYFTIEVSKLMEPFWTDYMNNKFIKLSRSDQENLICILKDISIN